MIWLNFQRFFAQMFYLYNSSAMHKKWIIFMCKLACEKNIIHFFVYGTLPHRKVATQERIWGVWLNCYYLYIFISFTINRNFMAVLPSLADLSCFHMSADYIFTHLHIKWGSIFLPPLACGFTLPQGDSRWTSSMPEINSGLGLSLLNTHF